MPQWMESNWATSIWKWRRNRVKDFQRSSVRRVGLSRCMSRSRQLVFRWLFSHTSNKENTIMVACRTWRRSPVCPVLCKVNRDLCPPFLPILRRHGATSTPETGSAAWPRLRRPIPGATVPHLQRYRKLKSERYHRRSSWSVQKDNERRLPDRRTPRPWLAGQASWQLESCHQAMWPWWLTVLRGLSSFINTPSG